MRLIIHLVNMFFLTLMIPIFILAFSFIFDFSYIATVHNEVFIFCESIFSVIMIFVYMAMECDAENNPVALINSNIV